VAGVTAEARMGRLIAQALHLTDQVQGVGFRINRIAADTANRVFLTRAVFVDHEQTFLGS
jgi:hypothetical protein